MTPVEIGWSSAGTATRRAPTHHGVLLEGWSNAPVVPDGFATERALRRPGGVFGLRLVADRTCPTCWGQGEILEPVPGGLARVRCGTCRGWCSVEVWQVERL